MLQEEWEVNELETNQIIAPATTTLPSMHRHSTTVLPKDWNKPVTEGSHTLTSSVRDLTWKRKVIQGTRV